jgi:hypothetical protein
MGLAEQEKQRASKNVSGLNTQSSGPSKNGNGRSKRSNF